MGYYWGKVDAEEVLEKMKDEGGKVEGDGSAETKTAAKSGGLRASGTYRQKPNVVVVFLFIRRVPDEQ